MPLFFADKDVDPLILIATGILSQEKRLQALEQRILPSREPAVGRMQEQDRENLDMLTRIRYLEEDVVDNRLHTDHKLQVVQDQLKELQRKESEDIRQLHKELETDVVLLEDEVNSTFSDTENDIDSVEHRLEIVKSGVNNNEGQYHHLRNGFFALIDYVKAVDLDLDDRLHKIEQDLQKIIEDLLDEDKNADVAPVGETGGIQGYPVKTMSSAEKALRDWLKQDQARQQNPSPTPPSASVESANSKELPATFEELLYELKKYNM